LSDEYGFWNTSCSRTRSCGRARLPSGETLRPSNATLPLVGATHEKARVVQDGNVITAAGVSSGIDFAFTAAAEIAGEAAARAIQLGIEYDPAPPFDSGSPDKASPAIKSAVIAQGYDKSLSAYRAGLERAARL